MQQHPEKGEVFALQVCSSAFYHIDATLCEVVAGQAPLPDNTPITLTVRRLMTSDALDSYKKGQRVVCLLVPYQTQNLNLENTFSTNKYLTWHLTKDDVILSATSEPGPDSFSGLYLESFKQEVLAILEENNK